jgi:hypothetical protein
MWAETVSTVQRLPGPLGAQTAAFGDLAGVPGRADAGAAHQRHRRQYGGVGGAAAQHDVGAGLQGGDVGLRPHQRHDVVAGLEPHRLGIGHGRQRRDAAGPGALRHGARRLLRVQQGDARGQAFLAGDLAGDVVRPVECRVAARGAAGADQQRDAGGGLRPHQDRQVGLDGIARILGQAGRQVGRSAVGGAGIAGDGVRAGGDAGGDVIGIDAHAEGADGHEDVDGVVGVAGIGMAVGGHGTRGDGKAAIIRSHRAAPCRVAPGRRHQRGLNSR